MDEPVRGLLAGCCPGVSCCASAAAPAQLSRRPALPVVALLTATPRHVVCRAVLQGAEAEQHGVPDGSIVKVGG